MAGVDCQCTVYRLLVGVWIFFGLAWLAGVLEVVQEKLQSIAISIESRLSPAAASNVDDHQVGDYRKTKLSGPTKSRPDGHARIRISTDPGGIRTAPGGVRTVSGRLRVAFSRTRTQCFSQNLGFKLCKELKQGFESGFGKQYVTVLFNVGMYRVCVRGVSVRCHMPALQRDIGYVVIARKADVSAVCGRV